MLRPRDGVGEVRHLLDEYLGRLKNRLPIQAVAVFGSRARGDHMRTSDVDVLVFSAFFEGVPRDQRIGLLLEDWPGGRALEPLGYTPEELLRLDHLVLLDALHDGRPLLDDGTWRRAAEQLHEQMLTGSLRRRPGGWSVRSVRGVSSESHERPARGHPG